MCANLDISCLSSSKPHSQANVVLYWFSKWFWQHAMTHLSYESHYMTHNSRVINLTNKKPFLRDPESNIAIAWRHLCLFIGCWFLGFGTPLVFIASWFWAPVTFSKVFTLDRMSHNCLLIFYESFLLMKRLTIGHSGFGSGHSCSGIQTPFESRANP